MGEARRKGQEGSRWINELPDPKALGKWFKENVKIEDGLEHSNYVQGITLIPATEKAKEVIGFDGDGNPLLGSGENLVYVPYAKVETRVKYFHDLMALKASEWVGFIEPVSPPKPDPNLPPGFFFLPVPTVDGKGVRFICCTMKVTVYKREGFKEKMVLVDSRKGLYESVREGEILIDAPPATKMIPTTTQGWGQKQGERVTVADPSSLMKAETGAVGRALGMAGMLVIPGTGVATAEDMVEALNEAPQSGTPQAETPPEAAPSAELPSERPVPTNEEIAALKQDAIAAVTALKDEYPDDFKLFQEWAASREITDLASITDATILRGLTAKAKKDFAEAKAAAEALEEK